MNHPMPQQPMESQLDEIRGEILEKWERNMRDHHAFSHFMFNGKVGETLSRVWEEYLGHLKNHPVPANLHAHLGEPVESVLKEIRSLYLAEETLAATLKKLIQKKEWPAVRFRLFQAFSRMLKSHTALACGRCQCAIKEDLALANYIQSHLTHQPNQATSTTETRSIP